MENIQLFQGDCLEIMDKLIEQGVKVDAIITDPPYGTIACKWNNIINIDFFIPTISNIIVTFNYIFYRRGVLFFYGVIAFFIK